MDYKNIMTLIIAALVGVVILAGFLPIITATQDTAGDSITINNAINDGNYYVRELKEGDVLIVEVTEGQTTKVKLNGEYVKTIEGTDIGAYHNLLMSDVLTVWSAAGTGSCQYGSNESIAIGYTNATATFTYSGGVFNIQYGTQNITLNDSPTWGFVVCNESDAGYYDSTRTGQYTFYIKNDNDVVCSGAYTTGDNDTYYWYYNGVAGVAEDYTCSYNFEKTLVDGTSDIYEAHCEFVVGDESFVPYRILIPLEVTGHKTSGALYEIFGLLPLIAGIGLLLMICIEVFRRYY